MSSSVMHFAVAEREEFLALLEDLRDEHWDNATLCAGWSVRDVVAHVLSFEDLSTLAAVRLILTAKVRGLDANEVAMTRYRHHTAAELIERMRTHLTPAGLTAKFQGGIALADGMIHQQDIRRPLGAARTIPAARVIAALRVAVAAPTLPSRHRLKGIRLVATDAEWTHGRGPAIHGPAEALLMLTAGRAEAAADCTGAGLHLWQTA